MFEVFGFANDKDMTFIRAKGIKNSDMRFETERLLAALFQSRTHFCPLSLLMKD